jgi:serine/threonine protein kinase
MVFSSGNMSRIKLDMRGGQLKGQGTYGCVFQPALRCRRKKPIDPSKVGKITSPIDAENELEIAKYLQTIPDATLYTVVAESDSCTPLVSAKQTDPDLDECRFTEDNALQKSVQLIMPWGGVPLNQLNLNPRTFDFFQFTEDLLAIGAFLVLNDICHFDIWGQNLLFDRKNKPRLIDFGFAFRPSEIDKFVLINRWREIGFDHNTETPEVTVMMGILDGISPSTTAQKLQFAKPAVQLLATLCNVNRSEWAADLVRWSNESQSFQQGDWESCWKLYWPGFDAWEIGAVLLDMLEAQVANHTFYTSRAWSERRSDTQTLLRGLCRAHPAYRMDAVEALHFWTNGKHSLVAAGSAGSDWVSQKKTVRPRPA